MMWVYAPQRSPFNAICRSFAREPKLAPGAPLYSLLHYPEEFGADNSPSALFSLLFDQRFQAHACSALPDLVALRKVCAWILEYMHRKQAAADNAFLARMLAGDDGWTPLYSHEEPIANPQALAYSLLKSGSPQRELGLIPADQAQQPAAPPALPTPPRSDVSDNSDATLDSLPQAWRAPLPAPTDMVGHSWVAPGMRTTSSSISLATAAAPSDSAGDTAYDHGIMSGDDEHSPAHFNVDDLVVPELPVSMLHTDVPAGYDTKAYLAGVNAAYAFLQPEPSSKADTAHDMVTVSRVEWEQVQHALDLAGVLVRQLM